MALDDLEEKLNKLFAKYESLREENGRLKDQIRLLEQERAELKAKLESLEGRLKIKYMCPLWGFGSSTIRELAGRLFEFEQNVSSVGFNADYEVELRTLIERMAGSSQVERIFPSHHIQSHITGMRGGR